VRHLWLTLRKLTQEKVNVTVAVDAGTPTELKWTALETEHFDDRGVKAPWAPTVGPAGTLVSNSESAPKRVQRTTARDIQL
jgi:hypothetical protein